MWEEEISLLNWASNKQNLGVGWAGLGWTGLAKYFYFLIKVNLLIENLDFFSRVFWLDWVYSGHLLE